MEINEAYKKAKMGDMIIKNDGPKHILSYIKGDEEPLWGSIYILGNNWKIIPEKDLPEN